MDFFVARLMSLSEHELRCLRADQELQGHLQRAHLLVESKLQQYNSNASSQAALMLAAAGDNYAALDLRLSEQQQLAGNQQHQQQHLQHLHQLQLQLQHNHQQQQQHQLQQLQLQHHHHQDHHHHNHHQRLQQQHQQLYLLQQQQQQQHQEKCFNYKKMKFIEWTASSNDEGSPTPPNSSSRLSTGSSTLARDEPPANESPVSTPDTPAAHTSTSASISATSTNQPHLSPAGALLTAAPVQSVTITATSTSTATTTSGKKYKGEFDEPSALEVELRLKQLMRDDNYHSKNSPRGECACILGSEFRDKSAASVLIMVDQWRQMPTEQRVTFKWDMNDLPKDIPLSDIKRFENLRREASSGRADFGGASKRKPLGIRGTRQFLLILYCLWGHPGRDDPMQREGYCPHCFAKIKKPNEQSTLVRVVNHFNMKHRRGANPRT